MVALVASYGRASTRSHREYTRCSEKCSIWRQFVLSFPARALNCSARPREGQRSVQVYQTRTGIVVADWSPFVGDTQMGRKSGPRCKTAAQVVAWLTEALT